MKKEEISFRNIRNNFIILYNMGDKFSVYSKMFPSEKGDNAILLYGYIDHYAGLSFEVLCCAKREENGHVILRNPNDSVSMKIRYDGIEGDIDYYENDILYKYQTKPKMISQHYGHGTELELVRRDTTFDGRRNEAFPDDIAVIFFKENVKIEVIWVRTERIVDGKIIGIILNDPFSNEFNVGAGDEIAIVPLKIDNGEIFPVAEFPWIYK